MHTVLKRTALRVACMAAAWGLIGTGIAQDMAPAVAQGPVQNAIGGPQARPGLPVARADGFYQALGGKQGIDAIVGDFVAIMIDDKRVNATFEGVNLERLRAKLAEQFCEVSGGPCRYSGKSMTESHEDLKTTNAQFNAAVENLQLAMTRHAVPSQVQNRLLGKLAPTQREIVTR